MYVKRLKINNFRCFESVELTLNYPGMAGTAELQHAGNVNLFLGANGSGKSSIFKALPLAVLAPVIKSSGLNADYFVRRKPHEELEDGDGNPILIKDRANIEAHLVLNEIDTKSLTVARDTIIGYTVIERTGDVEEIISIAFNDADLWQNIFYDDSPAFFLTAYGANRRTERPSGYSEGNRSPRYHRVAGQFEEYVGMVPFSLAHLQLKETRYLDEAVTIVNGLLPDEVRLTGAIDGQRRPLFNCDGIRMPFDALSDGYRTFIGWVWDLLYQLSGLKTSSRRRRKLIDFTGVVIVDEIDLFLHPEWQRTLLGQISQTFPNLQFLFSSHSPLVAGSVDAQNIFVLGDHKVEQYQEDIYGLTANQVLTSSYFGLRSTRAPMTGTLADAARRTLGFADPASLGQQAESEDTEVQDQVRRMLEEIRSR